MDMGNVLGLDGWISMDTCILHWHNLHWVMLMDRGKIITLSGEKLYLLGFQLFPSSPLLFMPPCISVVPLVTL